MSNLKWSAYFQLREGQMNLDFQEPTPDIQARQDLKSTLEDVARNLESAKDIFDGEVARIVSEMDTAAASSPLDDPYHKLVMETKQGILKIRQYLVDGMSRLSMRVDAQLSKQGDWVNRHNINSDPGRMGNEDWEMASNKHLSGYPEVPNDAREF